MLTSTHTIVINIETVIVHLCCCKEQLFITIFWIWLFLLFTTQYFVNLVCYLQTPEFARQVLKKKKNKSLNCHVKDFLVAIEDLKKCLPLQALSQLEHTPWVGVQVFHGRRGRLRLASQHVIHCSFFYTSSVKQDSLLLFCSSTKHPEHLTMAQNSGLIL